MLGVMVGCVGGVGVVVLLNDFIEKIHEKITFKVFQGLSFPSSNCATLGPCFLVKRSLYTIEFGISENVGVLLLEATSELVM